ncbi:adenylate/guanylate cyclase domain-containing protein [Mucilaginibacter psychrotolerans]|uniref:Adenylate/guanylate cyclase domain-containing protein n=1 Tax=Mucilaginibacter psychrotolerans TaxID=1524096 RepID=A0A4Y8SH13_9SPHI|nr:adenylate/guanylate cyclase domain-containing protein [Mucilaginibacter psychrotolerans]TFF37706.1 adenylate/guanylate cyclase domain-containing protein [Mucilaginibacter psychrotolerans]
MANFDQIRKFNLNYGKASAITRSADLVNLNEAFDPATIEKGLDNALANLGPHFLGCFEYGLPTDVALIFVDVCSFSTRFGDLLGDEIGDFFDAYYDIVVPIIYKHGGEVEKIIGDGIIAVFGRPFLDADIPKCIRQAAKCSKEIIRTAVDTQYSSKIALHSGPITYYQNKTGLYKEFTMIGRPLTELFRLESISEDDCVNYYEGTPVNEYFQARTLPLTASDSQRAQTPWCQYSKPIAGLKGVAFTNMSYIRYRQNL